MLIAFGCVAFVATSCASSDGRAGSGSEFEPTPRTIDTTPFAFPYLKPNDGPTTIPDGTGDVSVTKPAGPTATTTTQPNQLFLPPATDITSLCGMVLSLESMRVVLLGNTKDIEQQVRQLQANLLRYVEVSPASERPAVQEMQQHIARFADALATFGWNPSDPGATGLLEAIDSSLPPFEGFGERLDELRSYEASNCPE